MGTNSAVNGAAAGAVNDAIIDIGSNGIRMVIGRINGKGRIRREIKVRESIRLGEDSFSDSQEISEEKLQDTLLAFARFQEEFAAFKVRRVKAVATSALRDAKNKNWFVEQIFRNTGIAIDVIDGIEEARLIKKAIQKSYDLKNKTALLMDIGGGSIEFNLTKNGKIKRAQSFKIGTVRLLAKLAQRRDLTEKDFRELIKGSLKELRKNIVCDEKVDVFVGTGGNVDRISKLKGHLLGEGDLNFVTRPELKSISAAVFSRNFSERVHDLGLREDRADVILPALSICRAVLSTLDIDAIHVPRVGLREGILVDLAEEIEASPDKKQDVNLVLK